MKIHHMKLLPQYFEFIKNGTKRLELRLNDEKRRNIRVNDLIIFEKVSEDVEYLETIVKDIHKYSSFKNLLNDFDISLLADKSIKREDLLESLNKIYDVKEQEKYGVLGIEIELYNFKTDNINNYKNNQKEFNLLVDNIYKITSSLNTIYPGYKKWFYDTQVKGCLNSNRNIFFARDKDNNIVGVCSIKKSNNENKICTIYIIDTIRNQGVGTLLLEEAMKYLDTTKPFITFNEEILPMFEKIIKKYNWELVEVVSDIYGKDKKEYCYNGKLTNN